jgi:hypothetical protein
MTREDRELLMDRSKSPIGAASVGLWGLELAGPAMHGHLKRYEPVAGLAFQSNTEKPPMTGKHRLKSRRVQRTKQHRTVEVVDARTLTTHFLTLDVLTAGRLPKGRYIALCGQDVLPVSIVESGRNRCSFCVSIPRQRSRTR